MRRRGSPTVRSSGWARRSATRPRSCTRAGRSGCASSARTSTSSRATGRFGRSAADRHLRRGVQPAAHRSPDLRAGGSRSARARRGRLHAGWPRAAPHDRSGPGRRSPLDDVRARDDAGRALRRVAARGRQAGAVVHGRDAPRGALAVALGRAVPDPRRRPGGGAAGVARAGGGARAGDRGRGRAGRAPTGRDRRGCAVDLQRRSRRVLRDAADRRLVDAGAAPGSRRAADPVPGTGQGRQLHRRAVAVLGVGAGGSGGLMAMEPRELAERIASIAADVKATDIRVLDLREVLGYTDYFVVCSGNTERQTKAIYDRIYKELKDEHGLLPRREEGSREARWILMDYLDAVVHIFTPEARSFYRLEQLWGEAPAESVG